MSELPLHEEIERDVVGWIDAFVATPNSFYAGKFAPCPYARAAVSGGSVDVAVWQAGDVRRFIRDRASELRGKGKIQTRVMVFPPRVQWAFGISDFVETVNMELIADDVFINTGVAKHTRSRYPGSGDDSYFIVVANTLSEVLRGAKSLAKTRFYADWPAEHYRLVVERRAALAERYGRRPPP